MKIKVEECWNGLEFYFRCTFPNGDRVNIGYGSEVWQRKHATELRDYAVSNYGVNRNSIKLV